MVPRCKCVSLLKWTGIPLSVYQKKSYLGQLLRTHLTTPKGVGQVCLVRYGTLVHFRKEYFVLL